MSGVWLEKMKKRLEFSNISDIKLALSNQWPDSLFLTFDIDWASDEVIANTIDLVEKADVCATWFVTHDTPLLKRLRDNPKFELGIHPNFNNILAGKSDPVNGESAEEIVERLLLLVPEAKCVRSHSMTQSSVLLQMFREKGFTHDCNHFIPHHAGIKLRPWYLWAGFVKVPCFWEDDVAVIYRENLDEIKKLAFGEGLKVFSFHPIHVFLNTEKMERYEESRPYHRSPRELLRFRNNETPGARTALKTLLELE